MKTVHKVLLIIAISVVYFPVAGHDFLYFWDDQWVVMNRSFLFLTGQVLPIRLLFYSTLLIHVIVSHQRWGKIVVSILFGCDVPYPGINSNKRSCMWYDAGMFPSISERRIARELNENIITK